MQHTSADVLEYAALRDLIGRYVAGPLGRSELELMQPSTDRAVLEDSLAEVSEAMEFARTSPRLPLGGIVDTTPAVHKLRIEGASLEGQEIAHLINFLERATEVRLAIVTESAKFPRLSRRAALIGEFRLLLRDLSGKVLPNGGVADNASVALNRLRRDIERQQRHIQESLERFLRAHREEGVLQEEYVTIRSDRFVVPIITGQKRRVDGVIHGASGSGHTLFIEPLETIELNNELVRPSPSSTTASSRNSPARKDGAYICVMRATRCSRACSGASVAPSFR
jgi:DNA mismatch repair protein MutS2